MSDNFELEDARREIALLKTEVAQLREALNHLNQNLLTQSPIGGPLNIRRPVSKPMEILD